MLVFSYLTMKTILAKISVKYQHLRTKHLYKLVKKKNEITTENNR